MCVRVCVRMKETARPELRWNKLKAFHDILKINLLFLLSGHLSQCGGKKKKKSFCNCPGGGEGLAVSVSLGEQS